MGTYFFSFVVVLGVLIFFHELGHFLLAKLCGVRVETFSLGFGPRLMGKTIGGTDYRIAAIPLGGYVKMMGEDPDDELEPEELQFSFSNKPVLQRILIVAAGPVFNFLLAVLIFWGMFLTSGMPDIQFKKGAVIGAISPGMPAERAGLQKGDQIMTINGHDVADWDQMAAMITASKGDPQLMSIKRDGHLFDQQITPVLKEMLDNVYGEKKDRYIIGIGRAHQIITKKMNILNALGAGISKTVYLTKIMIVGLYKLIIGQLGLDNLGGPLTIAKMAGDQAKSGTGDLIFFIAFISINLAIINLFPIPVLDGGHLLFFTIELLKGQPLSIRVREIAMQGGMLALLLLMMLAIYNDIMRFSNQFIQLYHNFINIF